MLHFLHGRGHQGGKADQGRVVFFCRADDVLSRNILPQVYHLKTVILHHQGDQIFADVVDVALHGCQHHNGKFFPVFILQQIRLQNADGKFHRFRSGNQLGKEVPSAVEQLSHPVNGRHQAVIEDGSGFQTAFQRSFCQRRDAVPISLQHRLIEFASRASRDGQRACISCFSGSSHFPCSRYFFTGRC